MIKIKRAKNKQFYFVVVAKNNKVILTSETYKSKAGVWKGVKAAMVALHSNTAWVKDERGEEFSYNPFANK